LTTQAADQDQDAQLRQNTLGLSGVLAQSVAGIAPTTGVAVIIGLIFSVSGNGTWLVFLGSTIVILAIGYCISQFCRRFVTTGGLYPLSAKAGSFFGIVSAWAAALFVTISAPVLSLAFGIFLSDLLQQAGAPGGRWLLLLYMTFGIVVAGWFAYRDVRLSADVMLILEIVSISIIVALMCLTLARHAGSVFDSDQLHLRGVSFHQIVLGVVLTFFAFATFESAAVLGREAKNPTKAINVALMGSVAVSGAFFVFCSYSIVLGFSSVKGGGLAASSNPLFDLATLDGARWLGYVVEVGVIISFFSVITSNQNYTSRQLLTLARERLIPRVFGRIGPTTRTPVVAIGALAAGCFLTQLGLTLANAATLNVFAYLGTLTGYWLLLVYFLACVAMVVYLARARELRPHHVVVAAAAAAAIAYVFKVDTVPIPAHPYDVILFLAYGVIGLLLVGYAIMFVSKADALGRVGTSVDEDTLESAAETTRLEPTIQEEPPSTETGLAQG
jgi:amino acid transporter